MKSLNFKLMTNDKEIINENINYFIKDEVIKFSINGEYYEFDIKRDIFTKKNSESIIKFEIYSNLAIITLLENNLSFDMEFDLKIYEKTNNFIKFMYTFTTDENTTNCIIINY